MLKLVQDTSARGEEAPTTIDLDELCRLAAKQMLASALLAERQAYLDAHADLVDAPVSAWSWATATPRRGRLRWRRHGRGESPQGRRPPGGRHYRSVILPAYMRKSPKVTEVLPVLYLRGLSTGDFAPALAKFWAQRRACRPRRCNGSPSPGRTSVSAGPAP